MYLKTLKALLLSLCIAAVATISWAPNSLAAGGDLDQQVQELIKQNSALTDRLMQVEEQLTEMKAASETRTTTVVVEETETIIGRIEDTIHIHGLLEFGGGYYSQDMNHSSHTHGSDLCMPTVELGIGAEVNDWVSAGITLLYEDAAEWVEITDDDSFEVDEAIITIANPEVTPAFLMAGKMYVPFGALLTHFPDKPLTDGPLTLMLGETNEQALLIGVEMEGFTISAYAYNGDVEEKGQTDSYIENYGFDANYAFEDETQDLDLLIGASYISNIADSGNSVDEMLDGHDINQYADGADVYLHVGYQGMFLDGEYMTATDSFKTCDEVAGIWTCGNSYKPAVWNVEAGYNYNWWRNLEIAVKYAGSDDGGAFGFPKRRYGINFNQEIFDDTIFSVGYMYDWMHADDHADRNSRDLLFSQIAVEF